MSEHKVNGSEGAREGGLGHDILKKNRNFYIGVGGTVLEGLLSGSLFMLLYLCHAVSVVRAVRHEPGIDIDWCNCGHFPASYSDLQLWLYQSADWRRRGQQEHPAFYGRPFEDVSRCPGLPRDRPAIISIPSQAM